MSEYQNVTPYVDKKMVQKSYRPKAGQMSPGLMRAREPYRVKNAITGILLGAFGVGVWAWSISAVKQDEFTDIDEEAKILASSAKAKSPTTVTVSAPNDGKKVV